MHLIERKLGVTQSNTEKLLLLSLFLSMSMLGPFFQPVFGNTVIVMHHDASVDISLKALQEQTGPLHVIEYGSAEYLLVIHRLVDTVIWLSHGSDDGILTEIGHMEWFSFAKILDMTRATDIVLACNSDNLDAFVKNPVITFSGSIDARFGAAIVAWLLTGSITSLSFVFEIFIKLMTNDLSLLPLYWGPIEKMWFFLDAAIFILQTVSITFMVFWATLNPMSTLQLLAGVVYLGTALIQACEVLAALLTGNLTPWAFITKFLTVILPVVMQIMFGITPWWITAIIACEEAVAIATSVKIIAVLTALVGCYFLVTGLLNDQADPDDTYGRLTI